MQQLTILFGEFLNGDNAGSYVSHWGYLVYFFSQSIYLAGFSTGAWTDFLPNLLLFGLDNQTNLKLHGKSCLDAYDIGACGVEYRTRANQRQLNVVPGWQCWWSALHISGGEAVISHLKILSLKPRPINFKVKCSGRDFVS